MTSRVRAKFVPLRGGLDLVTPFGQVNPGSAIEMRNYEISTTGGYRRVDGYERMDGRAAPHLGNPVGYAPRVDLKAVMEDAPESEYPSYVQGERLLTPAVLRIPLVDLDLDLGQRFDYVNQFALSINDSAVAHYLIGQYPNAEALLKAIEALPGIEQARLVEDAIEISTGIEPPGGGHPSIALLAADFQRINPLEEDTTETRREAIEPLPGQGPVRGVAIFQGKVIASRDHEDQNFLYVATDEGWAGLTLPAPRIGGGEVRFAIGNFSGNPGDEALYLVDGRNPVLEIKGESLTVTEIPDCRSVVGALTLYPSLVAIHKGHLFVGYPAGSVQHSGIGDPFAWDVDAGAGEIALGQPLVEIAGLPGDALGLFTEESVRVLYGTSAADWRVERVGSAIDGVRVIPNTIQTLGEPLFADSLGVRALATVSAYGNFRMSTATALVQPLYDQLRGGIRCSVISREKNQYRLLGEGGSCLILTSSGEQLLGIGYAQYGFEPVCAAFGPDHNGHERMVVGAEDGYVYDLDVGDSFDGEPIDAALQLHFNHLGTPRNQKRFRKAVFDMDVPVAFDMRANLIFNYGGSDHAQHLEGVADITGSHGLWNVDDWGSFRWGGKQMSEGEIDITGNGRNLSILLYTKAIVPAYELNGLTLHYSVRRLER